jgi:hypothetical protein
MKNVKEIAKMINCPQTTMHAQEEACVNLLNQQSVWMPYPNDAVSLHKHGEESQGTNLYVKASSHPEG